MLTTRLIIRLLNAQGQLLGWAEALGEARGDGALWVWAPTNIGIEVNGILTHVSVHWCDVNVEVRVVAAPQTVTLGQVITLPGNWEAMRCGPAAGGLPPVTVRTPVSVGLLAGSLVGKG